MSGSREDDEGYVTAKGYRIHYLERGDTGEKIVFLHGLAPIASARNFELFYKAMSNDFHILAFDLLGHGESDDPREPLGFEEHADIMREAAIQKGFTRYALIGYSFGGWISMRYAAKYPEDIAKLVLVDIAPRTHEVPTPAPVDRSWPHSFKNDEDATNYIIPAFQLTDEEYWMEFWKDNMDYWLRRDDEDRLHVPSHPIRKENLMYTGDGWSFLGSVSAPVLLFRGSESMLVTDEDAARMREVQEGLRVLTIQGADHTVPFTHPEEFQEAIRSFLNDEKTRSN